MIPVKIEISQNEDNTTIIYAETPEGVVAGQIEFAPVNLNDKNEPGMIRLLWIEVMDDYRHGGIGTILIDALTSHLSEFETMPILTAWYDDDDVKNGFEDFLDSTALFDVNDEIINGKKVHIAVWNGHTFEEQYIEE
ncbi:MAG: hypothetical protein J6Z05_09345 [Lachnospiraceae bacterium]|nr:hypothetical protein [Lachnospiraceae bacterium]